MTKQNPIEFKDKPYLYKFIRSMFSSSSDARMNNPQPPKLYYKIPFTSHFDMPYIAEDVRINGFGHLFSGIFMQCNKMKYCSYSVCIHIYKGKYFIN